MSGSGCIAGCPRRACGRKGLIEWIWLGPEGPGIAWCGIGIGIDACCGIGGAGNDA